MESGYQGYAQTTGFNPIKVSQANVEAIARDGARTIAGMERVAQQDLKNRQAQLDAVTRNNQLEKENRDQNFLAQQAERDAFRNAMQLNYETELKSIETRGNNATKMFRDLSSFSTKAGEIANNVISDIEENRETAEMWSEVLFGVSNKELMAQLESEKKMEIAGEVLEIKADQLEAMGADPVTINSYRQQNGARLIRNKKGRVMAAIRSFPEYLNAAFEDERLEVTFKQADGTVRTIKASEAVTSADRAAVFPEIYKRFLVDNDLFKLRGSMLAPLHEVAYNQFTATTGAARKLELQESKAKALEEATDYLADSGSTEAFQNLWRTLKRQSGYVEGRKSLFNHIFTATDGKGGMLYSDSQIEEFVGQSFDDQPTNSLGARFSAEIAKYRSDRTKAQTGFINEITGAQNAQNDQWTNEAESWVQSNNPNQQQLEDLIETAKRNGNFTGAKVIASYLEFTPEGQQEKYFDELFSSYEAEGTLTQEEVRKAPISSKAKAEWLKKASENESIAIDKETKKDIDTYLESKLRERINDVKGETKNPTFGLALRSAKSQALRDYHTKLMEPGATKEQAFEYALGRFNNEFEKETGRYKVKDVTEKGVYRPSFSNFEIKAATQMAYPLNEVMQKVKAHDDALDSQDLIPTSELQKVVKQRNAGKALSIPPAAQAIANMYGGNINPLEVLNRQLKRAGLEQVPIDLYKQRLTITDPEYQRLLTYRPNTTRATIAGIGSGYGMAPAVRRQGAVNTAGEIMSTFLAAGGSDKDAVLMTAIAMAESSGRQDAARSDTDVHGWFQVRYPVHIEKLRALGINSRNQLLDPMNNSKAALAILNSQGLGAWEAYTNGAYKQYMPQAEAAMRSYGEGPWRHGTNIRPRVIEYLTGDRSHPRFASDHGGSNYHEHIAYATSAEALLAARRLEAHGIKVTELKGHSAVGGHSKNSYHYSGQAFDVPADQVPVGKEQDLSRRVRAILGIK